MFGMYVSELKLDPRLVHVCDFVIFEPEYLTEDGQHDVFSRSDRSWH